MATLKLLPAGTCVSVPNGTPLKDVLFEHGVEFPCGGKGRCKGCRIRVLEGTLPVHPEERQKLTPSEIANGWRLACLGTLQSDLTLELAQWEATILSDDAPFDFTPADGFGIAVDLGTTTIVAQLLNLRTGDVLAVSSGLNAQARNGADVMSRIEFAISRHRQSAYEADIRQQLGEMLASLCAGQGVGADLRKVVIVGNTVMHHLFCGIDVEPLSHYPFQPAKPGLQEFTVDSLGWRLPGNPVIQFLPCIAGFVGSDILAGILATGLHTSDSLVALIDLGTNGEIVLGKKGRLLCTSTAAGPAFEGAGISMGMRASTGAISEVCHHQGEILCKVIGGGPARGICGSGLVDAIATGLDTGKIRHNGRFTSAETLPLCDSVSLTQWDIRQFQMAKGAIAAGLKILCYEYDATIKDLSRVYLAGAFGNYINIESGQRVGLFNTKTDRIQPAGNTALLGAKMSLFAANQDPCESILKATQHISLNEIEYFQDAYAEEMHFPQVLP